MDPNYPLRARLYDIEFECCQVFLSLLLLFGVFGLFAVQFVGEVSSETCVKMGCVIEDLTN